jgi:hypothetical protein
MKDKQFFQTNSNSKKNRPIFQTNSNTDSKRDKPTFQIDLNINSKKDIPTFQTNLDIDSKKNKPIQEHSKYQIDLDSLLKHKPSKFLKL